MTPFASRSSLVLGLVSALAFGCGSSSKNSPHDGSTDLDGDASPGDASADTLATDAGADQSGDASPEAGRDGGAACLGNVSIDFSSLAPDWLDVSTACGTASVSNNALVLNRNGACNSDASGGAVQLSAALQLCGDFDIQVAFNLATFPFPTAGGRYASMRAYDPENPAQGIAIEMFDNDCNSAPVAYKSWTTDYNGCLAAHAATTDTSGKMRLTRSGATVTSYYSATGDAGATWTAMKTDTLTSTPWTLQLYTGYNPPGSGDTQSQSVSFSNLVITSTSTP